MKNPIDSLKDDLPSGGTTKFTSITGAIGNYGMILGAGTVVAHHVYNLAWKKDKSILRDKWGMATIIASAAGVAFGVVHGIKEARDIQNYREAVAGKIDALTARSQADQEKIDALIKAVQAQAEDKQLAAAR